jgi:hypothetical protein
MSLGCIGTGPCDTMAPSDVTWIPTYGRLGTIVPSMPMPYIENGKQNGTVRGYLSVSLPLLSFPTPPLNSPFSYVYYPHLCNTSVPSPGTIFTANNSRI